MSNPTPAFANGHNGGEIADSIIPAGAKDSHHPGQHGHTIVPLRLLIGVLVILLVFTVLTVSAANAEEWFSRTFDVEIPGWVNAVVALSIACVKSIIVAMYFMQLRYDHNPMNALVAVFTIMVATFFLGFIAIDLGNRGMIYQIKAEAITPGGVGGFSRGKGDNLEQIPAGTPIAVYARQKADKTIEEKLNKGEKIENHAYKIRLYNYYHELLATPNLDAPKKELMEKMAKYMENDEEEYKEIAAYLAEHTPHHAKHVTVEGNTANVSRTHSGVTLSEFGGGEGGEHGEGHAPTPAHEKEPSKDTKDPVKEPAPAGTPGH